MARKIKSSASAALSTNEKAAAFLNFKIRTTNGTYKNIGKFGLGLFESNKLDKYLIEVLQDSDKMEDFKDLLQISLHVVDTENEVDMADIIPL